MVKQRKESTPCALLHFNTLNVKDADLHLKRHVAAVMCLRLLSKYPNEEVPQKDQEPMHMGGSSIHFGGRATPCVHPFTYMQLPHLLPLNWVGYVVHEGIA